MNATEQLSQNIQERVDQALDSIRPYLEADGGNVRILEVTEDKVVHLEFMGACGSCRMSTMTFKAGVEEAIKKGVPEITAIVVVNLTPPV